MNVIVGITTNFKYKKKTIILTHSKKATPLITTLRHVSPLPDTWTLPQPRRRATCAPSVSHKFLFKSTSPEFTALSSEKSLVSSENPSSSQTTDTNEQAETQPATPKPNQRDMDPDGNIVDAAVSKSLKRQTDISTGIGPTGTDTPAPKDIMPHNTDHMEHSLEEPLSRPRGALFEAGSGLKSEKSDLKTPEPIKEEQPVNSDAESKPLE